MTRYIVDPDDPDDIVDGVRLIQRLVREGREAKARIAELEAEVAKLRAMLGPTALRQLEIQEHLAELKGDKP